ncbi:MAG: DUF4277 domain-containing protein [Symbiobacteriaceae bacterium]|nr:DUF4277 domain-containing protein [Symbiobacteriaceae bacterium]
MYSIFDFYRGYYCDLVFGHGVTSDNLNDYALARSMAN